MTGQIFLDMGEVVFDFQNAACEGNNIFLEGIILGTGPSVRSFVEVDERRLEATTSDLRSSTTEVREATYFSSIWVRQSVRAVNDVGEGC